MMIYSYRGKGYWVPWVPLGVLPAAGFLWKGVQQVFGVTDDISGLGTGFAIIVGGVVLRAWGRNLNRPLEVAEAEAAEEAAEEGEEVDQRLKYRHSFCGYPMEEWGTVVIVLGGLGLLLSLLS